MHMQPEEAEEARIRLVWKRWKVEHGAMHREGDRPMRMTLVVERTIPIDARVRGHGMHRSTILRRDSLATCDGVRAGNVDGSVDAAKKTHPREGQRCTRGVRRRATCGSPYSRACGDAGGHRSASVAALLYSDKHYSSGALFLSRESDI
jgi:hypothetical protein